MIFKNLTLHNFGVYSGHQTFDLNTDDGKPIIVIGALNGSGKTTFLTAIQLLLYGQLSPDFKGQNSSYSEYLKNKINRTGSIHNGAAIELELALSGDSGEQVYKIRRAWSVTKNGKIKEDFVVAIDDKNDEFVTDNWGEHIEGLLPNRIMPLFFFDGEKIEELAQEEHASEILEVAVHGLLGLDIVGRLNSDLLVYENRKKKESASAEGLADIEIAEQKFNEMNHQSKKISGEISSLKDPLLQNQNKLSGAQRRFASEGGESFEKRDALTNQRKNKQLEFEENAKLMFSLAENACPLLLVKELVEQAALQADTEELSKNVEAVVEILALHDKKVLNHLEKSQVKKTTLSTLEEMLRDEREKLATTSKQDQILELSPSSSRKIHSLISGGFKSLEDDILKHTQLATKLNDTLDEQDKAIASIPDEEKIAPLRETIKFHETKIVQITHDKQKLEGELHSMEWQVGKAKKFLQDEINKNVTSVLESEDAARTLKHSELTRIKLDQFKKIMLTKKLGDLERLIVSCFNDLTHKTDLIAEAKIDIDTFDLTLKGGELENILPSELSAGERQLLSTAVLWALSKASKRSIPAIIDTPLGRLDSKHRATLGSNYFPAASHQVILLSTDEEVDEDYLKLIEPWVSKKYFVEHDSSLGGSVVKEGYYF
jgi:DNA sulfur modification protein DndD